MRLLSKLFKKIIKVFLRLLPLQNIIMICSHNDFDVNGGAFYDYLIANNYNNKWRIVWLLRNPELKPKILPHNVDWVPLNNNSIKKTLYFYSAKILTTDDYFLSKYKKNQRLFFLTHGCGGFKSVKGKMNIPSFYDYILLQSESYSTIQAPQYNLDPNDKRIVYLGYPCHDLLHINDASELFKIRSTKFSKVILWMPTFRKHFGDSRNDSTVVMPFDVPLIKNFSEFEELNRYLSVHDILLIVKIHPFQDVTNMEISSLSNIEVLTGNEVKKRNIDNYRLMRSVDALISDYSGAAYEFLQCNKPIAYVTSDMNEYSIGFVVDDIRALMAGPEIKTIDDMYAFIKSVSLDCDEFADKRAKIRDFIYKYNDANNCKRLTEFMKL